MLIPNIDVLCDLTNKINEIFHGKDLSNMTIVFELDEKSLNRVNEDFYYRNNFDSSFNKTENVDEVNVNIGGVKYKYIKKEE